MNNRDNVNKMYKKIKIEAKIQTDSEVLNKFNYLWLGMRDSNPRSWDQNPVPYRLANPQSVNKINRG